MVLLQTTEKGGDFNNHLRIIIKLRISLVVDIVCNSFFTGACFIRTDQLDGETDWKLRLAVGTCQRLRSNRVQKLFASSALMGILVILNVFIHFFRNYFLSMLPYLQKNLAWIFMTLLEHSMRLADTTIKDTNLFYDCPIIYSMMNYFPLSD